MANDSFSLSIYDDQMQVEKYEISAFVREVTELFEGHPTPRLPFVDVATGSLGQGLPVGIGIALSARMDRRDQRVYVLMGDGESAEDSVWEAAEIASNYGTPTQSRPMCMMRRQRETAPPSVARSL